MALASIPDADSRQTLPAQNATKGPGWPCGEPPTNGYPADRCLGDVLETLRPWQARAALEDALQGWWDGHYPGHPMRGDVADVAEQLEAIGAVCRPLPDAETVVGMVAFMLVNVGAGRAPDDDDMLRRIVVKGVPASTARRLHAAHRGHGLDDFSAWMAGLRYRGDVRALVAGGKSEAAARRWLQRNPGEHAPSPGSPWRPPRKG